MLAAYFQTNPCSMFEQNPNNHLITTIYMLHHSISRYISINLCLFHSHTSLYNLNPLEICPKSFPQTLKSPARGRRWAAPESQGAPGPGRNTPGGVPCRRLGGGLERPRGPETAEIGSLKCYSWSMLIDMLIHVRSFLFFCILMNYS